MNCLDKILKDIRRFEDLFSLSEGQISTWVRNESFSRDPPSNTWCVLFSFGFDDPPTSHYTLLLHDLRNHFPDLVDKLKKFESEIRELCPLYNELLYRITKLVYSKATSIINEVPGKDLLTEVTVMSLAGYREWDYPNDVRVLKDKDLYKHVSEIIEDMKRNNAELLKAFIAVRSKGLALIRDVKKHIIEVMHMQKLPGKCSLY